METTIQGLGIWESIWGGGGFRVWGFRGIGCGV